MHFFLKIMCPKFSALWKTMPLFINLCEVQKKLLSPRKRASPTCGYKYKYWEVTYIILPVKNLIGLNGSKGKSNIYKLQRSEQSWMADVMGRSLGTMGDNINMICQDTLYSYYMNIMKYSKMKLLKNIIYNYFIIRRYQ